MSGSGERWSNEGMKLSHLLLITTLVGGLGLTGSAQGGAGRESRAAAYADADAHLIIKRAPNFGNNTNISVYIDGRLTTILSYGRGYEGDLAAGLHLVTMRQGPHLNDAYPVSQQWIRVHPGRTSAFTAIWRGGGTRIALEES